MSGYSNNYITSQLPNRFGGNQAEYLQRTDEAINWSIARVKEGRDNPEIFSIIIDHLANVRHDIAMSHETNNAKCFGRRRMDLLEDPASFTTLVGPYKEYNKKLLSSIRKGLNDAISPLGEVTKKELLEEEDCLGYKGRFGMTVLNEHDIRDRKWHTTPQKTPEVNELLMEDLKGLKGLDFYLSNFPPTVEEKKVLEAHNTRIKKLKETHPEYYWQNKMCSAIHDLESFPEHSYKKIHVIGKISIEIENRFYVLSEFVTWIDQGIDSTKDSHVIIVHQDRFLIDETLKVVAGIFKKAIYWDSSKEDLVKLKDQVALVRYLFSHAMPYGRGSASIGESLEKILYGIHRYHCRHNANMLGDLEALTTSWSTFRKERYDLSITLTPIAI